MSSPVLPTHVGGPGGQGDGLAAAAPSSTRQPLNRGLSTASIPPQLEPLPLADPIILPALVRQESRVLAGQQGLDYAREEDPSIARTLQRTQTNASMRTVESLRHRNEFDDAPAMGQGMRGRTETRLDAPIRENSGLSADRNGDSGSDVEPSMKASTSSGKATVVADEAASIGKADDEKRLSAGSDSEGQQVDLGDGKVLVGTDKETGKLQIKDRQYVTGGPYVKPKWRHSLPFMKPKDPPPPPKANLDDADEIPESHVNWFNQLTYHWITPLMALGALRPLEAGDLWKLAPEREAKYMAQQLATRFQERWDKAEAYNIKLDAGEVPVPRMKRVKWALGMGGKGSKQEKEKRWKEKDGRKKPSLAWALSDVYGWYWWTGLIWKVAGDTSQVCSSLVVKRIIAFAASYRAAQDAGRPTPNVGYGIGMSILLAALLMISSIGLNKFFMKGAGVGVYLRAAIISALYERSFRLTGRARIEHTNSKLVTHISADVSRIDFASGFAGMLFTSPIQFIVVVIILLVQIRESALVGIAFLLVFTPLQTRIMKYLFSVRKKSMVWTDARIRLFSELLNGMKIVKLMAWEVPFLERLNKIRRTEVTLVRALLITRAGNMAVAMSLPILAAILSFITYASIQSEVPDAATLFTVITLFQLIRLPLMLFPMTLSTATDAMQAIGRIEGVFMAETRTDKIEIDLDQEVGIKVQNASWTWDSAPQTEEEKPKKGKGGPAGMDKKAPAAGKKSLPWKKSTKGQKTDTEKDVLEQHAAIADRTNTLEEAGDPYQTADPGVQDSSKPAIQQSEIFQMRNVDLEIPRGSLVAVVGAIGSGKSSLLSGLTNEMRRLEGKVTFCGSIGLVPQTPWIVNATIRSNILFGLPYDEEQYWWAIREACMEPDLALLPDGDATEIGEKGINLSGGQKQRVSIARAFYFATKNPDCECILFDDPISALDPGIAAGVWQSISRLKGKTRVVVTHALHFLPSTDMIITLADGRVAEQGTYEELKNQDGAFARLIREFANEDADESKKEKEANALEIDHRPKAIYTRAEMTATVEEARKLMKVETMGQGGMRGSVYTSYIKAGRGFSMPYMFILLILSVIVAQAFTLMTSFWLVFWQERKWPRGDSFYEGTYAALGVGTAVFLFAMGATQGVLSYFASVNLYQSAISKLLRAPMSFFETTPTGQILNRASKDVDIADNNLPDSLRMAISTLANVLGAIVLIAIVEPYFLIVVFVVAVLYLQLAQFYRKSSLSFKRLDAILRSPLYAHFSESLSGLPVIRSYGESQRFINENCRLMSIENRAYICTVVNQRWLGLRLDGLGTCLTFAIALFTCLNHSISPASGGLALSYMLTVQQSLSWLCRQYAEVENDMNSIERLLEYGNELEQEAPHEIPDAKPPAAWPSEGRIEFKDVVMRYRPELPPALKNFTMSVGKAEKIGICGRTGAGKSTILTTLFRLVELSEGSILVDGVDISKIGLTDLRQALSIIPQEPLLFSGTIRSNLDPFSLHPDAVLWDAMRRAHLVDSAALIEKAHTPSSDLEKSGEGSGAHTPVTGRFTLDTVLEDEGNNLSVGERSLVSLARAIVRNSRISVLDEATAAVDLETDQKIQETIRREFKDKTLLCIAHRLRTILGWDRILVMSQGEIAEFDTPRNLFLREDGIFRQMCVKSNISLEDVEAAAKQAQE